MGAPTMVETGLVLSRRFGRRAEPRLQRLVRELDLLIVPFTEEHWQVALAAFQRFGRGRHKVGLNFGDCLSYAVASVANDTLLFIGDHFAHTDIPPA